jgi:hypothetical protein
MRFNWCVCVFILSFNSLDGMHVVVCVQHVNHQHMLPPMPTHGNTTTRVRPDGIRELMLSLLNLLMRCLGPETVPVIEIHTPPNASTDARTANFLRRFNELKQGPPVVLKQTGAHLAYTFRGDIRSHPVHVIGVPSYDAVVYIAATTGRVAMTGERTRELASLLMSRDATASATFTPFSNKD